mmetsp:Transcript_24156/g.48797  ORF Transcript_24156/g.48797 Transcript_24156/m.48797 type:complete len:104 (-) Transcript_24156:477-788(-)
MTMQVGMFISEDEGFGNHFREKKIHQSELHVAQNETGPIVHNCCSLKLRGMCYSSVSSSSLEACCSIDLPTSTPAINKQIKKARWLREIASKVECTPASLRPN